MQKDKLLFAISMTAAKHIAFCKVERGVLLSHALAVLAFDRWAEFGIVSCSLHDTWTRMHTSYNLALPRYIHTDCFLTFPFPALTADLDKLSQSYYEHRLSVMKSRLEGSTDTYNRFHDRGEKSEDIVRLRALHIHLDQAVTAAYGWRELDLGHDFHETKQGERFTLSESARRAVLDKLLELNHQRYAEEVKAGLHAKGAKKAKAPKRAKDLPETQKPAGVQFGLALAAPSAGARSLPGGFRFTVSDLAIYGVNLINALLSEAGGSLSWQHLRDGFVFATRPDLMRKYAAAEDAQCVEAWAQRWNEKATPKLLPACLKSMGSKNLFVRAHGSDFEFQLPDGPKKPSSDDVSYDAWLALRVSTQINGQQVPLPESEEWIEDVRQLVAAA